MIFQKHQVRRVKILQFGLRHLFAAATLTAIVLALIMHFNKGPAAPRFDQGDFDEAY